MHILFQKKTSLKEEKVAVAEEGSAGTAPDLPPPCPQQCPSPLYSPEARPGTNRVDKMIDLAKNLT